MELAQIVEELQALADKKGITPAQLALAWVAAQGDDIIPIPGQSHCTDVLAPGYKKIGTKSIPRLDENWKSREVVFSPDELKEMRKVINSVNIQGQRFVFFVVQCGLIPHGVYIGIPLTE